MTGTGSTTSDLQDRQCRLAVLILPEDRDATLSVFERTLKFSPLNARVRLRHLPGVLPERFDRQMAERAAEELERIGGVTAAVLEAEIPDLQHARRLHHVRCRPEGLEILGISGRTEEILPWNRAALMSIGEVPLGTSKHDLGSTAGVVHPAPVPPTDTVVAQHYGAEMWLTTEKPFRAFHIEHEAMNYEYLGQRKSTSATANFQELVLDVHAAAPALFLTGAARAYLEHGSADQFRFDSQEAHRSYVRAQVLLMRRCWS